MTDPLADIRRWSDLLSCAELERREQARTYVVPDREIAVQIEAVAAALGVDDLVTVVVSAMCPAGQVFVIDEAALKAANAEMVQHLSRRPLF